MNKRILVVIKSDAVLAPIVGWASLVRSCSFRAHDWSLPCTNQSRYVPTRCSNETGHPHRRARNSFRHRALVAGFEPTCRQITPRGCPVFRAIVGPIDQTCVASAGGWPARARVGGGAQRGAGGALCRAGSSALPRAGGGTRYA